MNITVGLALLLIAGLLLAWGLRVRARTGLPWAPVRYSDAGWQAPEKPLTSRRLGLTGKPDYMVALGGRLIPVEVKPGRMACCAMPRQPFVSPIPPGSATTYLP
jgi:CRISPR-associated exonuclease Cas4